MTQEISQFSSPPEVRVVEASAGSGKTYSLARRYVQLLLNPKVAANQILLRHILAITFTNKAAYGMKGRILEFLKKIALGVMSPNEVKEILDPLSLTLPEAKPVAGRIMEELIHRYNFFQVQTIDSFINALLSGCAFKIGLSAGFKIKRNYSDYLESSFDLMIERASADPVTAEILSRFLHQYLFLENKTGWFPKKDMLDLLNALYSQSNTYGQDFVPMKLKGDELFLRKKKILVLMRELQGLLPEGTHTKFVDGLKEFLDRYHQGFDFDRVSNYWSREEVPVTKGVIVPRGADQLWGKIQDQLRELSEFEAYSLFDPYVEVFDRVTRDFHSRAAKEDVLFLPELNRRAAELFDEGRVTVEELYYRLATRFHHYLLDEFQDTSRLQWQNLEMMIEEALSTGGTFFYVGDKKQAIYGFRGGEVKLFDEVKDRFAAFNVQTEVLDTNYRSEKAIVDLNNAVFAPENLKRFIHELQEEKSESAPLSPMDIAEVESIFHGSFQKIQTGREGGYVRIEHVFAKDPKGRDEDIKARLIVLINNLKERFSYSQIAILTRDNREIERITGWLMAEGISVESERTLNIKANTLIQEILAFLRFLDSPVDNLSFAKFISGDLFQKVSGLSQEETQSFLFGQREHKDRHKEYYLYRAFRDRYPELWEKYFADFFKNVGLFPLYELSASILRRLGVYAHFADENGFFLRFLELIKEKEEEFSDLNSFLENFDSFADDELFVTVVNSDAIKILTVHKAKGLEFPVVIIPFLGMKVHAASGGGLGQQSYIVDPSEKDLKLLRIKAKYLQFSEKLAEVDRSQRVKSFISELNNIYVALTRAGKELYAFIPSKSDEKRSMIASLIPEAYMQAGAQQKYSLIPGEKTENRLGLPATEHAMCEGVPRPPGEAEGEHDWIEFLKEEFTDTDSVFRRKEIRHGTVMHDLLSRIGNLRETDLPELIRRTLDESRATFPQISDWECYEKDLKRLLGNQDLQPFLNISDGNIFLERDVVDPTGKTRRIDRLIIKKSEVWIIDYKSSREGREKYFDQVKSYIDILRNIEPDKDVKGFLIYLDDAGFEEVK